MYGNRPPQPARRDTPRAVSVSQGFRFECAGARALFLVGDFNGWRFPGLPMERHGGTTWTVRVALPIGPHLLTCYAEHARALASGGGPRRFWPAKMLSVEVRPCVAPDPAGAARRAWYAEADQRWSPPVWVDLPPRRVASSDPPRKSVSDG